MKIVATVFLSLVMTATYAQTHRIAQRSHGGKNHYRSEREEGNYGIPMHSIPQYAIGLPRVSVPSKVTWVPDTIGDSIVWRLDTLALAKENSATPTVNYSNIIITDVSQLGHVCGKISDGK